MTRGRHCVWFDEQAIAVTSQRVALSQHSKNVLWSESAGHCQNPQCRLDLHSLAEEATVGELAHIIPASDDGPRSGESAELDSHEKSLPENVLVLCPTCHTVIDKGPDAYPVATLRSWKVSSQLLRSRTYGSPVFTSRETARSAVEPLLTENKVVHDRYGPIPDVFDDVRADQWSRQIQKVIVPNNLRLLAIINANRHHLTPHETETVGLFTIHAEDLRARHEDADWTPGSVQFPAEIADLFLALEPSHDIQT